MIYGIVKAVDLFTVSTKEANKALDDAVSNYKSTKSNLESINSELIEQNKQIQELQSKDKLTYAEQGQLEELQAINKEPVSYTHLVKERETNNFKGSE